MGSVQKNDSGRWEAIVIGAGQAGLSTSYSLKQLGIDHIVLERGVVANSWARERWDSFRLNTPNMYTRLPGGAYDGPDPEGFLARDEVVEFFDDYARRFELPVQGDTEVLEARRVGSEWHLQTNRGSFATRNLIVCAGAFADAKFPRPAAKLSPEITQVHTSTYRNPSQLPPGAVLVVGSGQSGVQVAEDLLNGGRKVYLCVSRCPRIPRRYRGRDAIVWLNDIGFLGQRVEDLESPHDRDLCHPQIAGRGEPPDVNVRYLASRGTVLFGHFEGADGTVIEVADNVEDSLRTSDEISRMLLDKIDAYAAANNMSLPPAEPAARDFTLPPIDHRTALDLRTEGISSIVWATGFHHGFPWLRDCPNDEDGYPLHKEGVAAVEGLYFVGLHFLRARESGLLLGVGKDAQRIARSVAAHAQPQAPRVRPPASNGQQPGRHATSLELRRVLLVDADPEFEQLVDEQLGPYGFEIHAVSPDEDDPLSLVEELTPELVLIAVEEPDKSGYSLYSKAKKGVATDIPVILTTRTVSFSGHRTLKVHADEYLDKREISGAELLSKLDKLVGLGGDKSHVEEIELDEIEMLAAEGLSEEIGFETDAAFDALTTVGPVPDVVEEAPVADTSTSKRATPVPQPIAKPPRLTTVLGPGQPEKATGAPRSESSGPVSSKAPTRLEELERENARLAREIEELRRDAGGGFAHKREFLNLRELINKKDKEILDLRDEVGSRDRRILDLEEQNVRIGWERRDFEAKAGELEAKLVELNASRADAEQHAHAEAVAELDAARAELAAQAKVIEERRAEVERLKRAIADLENENTSYQEQVLEAYRRIKANASTVARAKKAMAIALTLLDEEHKNGEPDRPADERSDRPAPKSA